MSQPRLGSGKRFSHLAAALAKQHGVQNPAALAAWIGRKKYGNAGMQTLALHQEAKPIHRHRHVRQQLADLHKPPVGSLAVNTPDRRSDYPPGITMRKGR